MAASMAKTVSTAVMSSQPAANDKTNDCGLASGGIRKVNFATGGENLDSPSLLT